MDQVNLDTYRLGFSSFRFSPFFPSSSFLLFHHHFAKAFFLYLQLYCFPCSSFLPIQANTFFYFSVMTMYTGKNYHLINILQYTVLLIYPWRKSIFALRKTRKSIPIYCQNAMYLFVITIVILIPGRWNSC